MGIDPLAQFDRITEGTKEKETKDMEKKSTNEPQSPANPELTPKPAMAPDAGVPVPPADKTDGANNFQDMVIEAEAAKVPIITPADLAEQQVSGDASSA